MFDLHGRHWSLFHTAAHFTGIVLGLLAGFSFVWAGPDDGSNHLITAFLWVLIASTAMTIAYATVNRVQRGEWLRCLELGAVMMLLPTTLYLLGLVLAAGGAASTVLLPDGSNVAGRPDVLNVAPILYGAALLMAVLVGPGYMLTSPYKRPTAAAPVPASNHHEHDHTT